MMDEECLRDASVGLSQMHENGQTPSTDFYPTTLTSGQNSKNNEARKRISKIIDGGLREFSHRVCQKVESKGRTTYNEVADEIIAELVAAQSNSSVSLNENDEKNIQRRVYDSLNVLMALDVITKVRKEIQWKGLPNSNARDMEDIKVQRAQLMSGIQKKAAYLKYLEDQVADLQNLMWRNYGLLQSGKVPQGFSLPFILVRTTAHATVEIEISEDMRLVLLDFNSTPFTLYDDASILRLMGRYQLPERENTS